jgi:hypothetical protein
MEILWSWKSELQSQVAKRLNLLQNDILHELTFSNNQQLLTYTLTKYPHSLPDTHWMEWETPASLVPAQFDQINVFQQSTVNTAGIDRVHSLQFLVDQHPTATSHFMQLLWPEAKLSAIDATYSVFAWYHQNQFILFAFYQSELLIANTYRVNNPQECLYFTLLPFHQRKMKPSELKVILFADFFSPQGNQTKQVFSKLIPHTQFLNNIDQEILNQNPSPMAHFVSFLINAEACALPVEN